jgi:hypothetical protein
MGAPCSQWIARSPVRNGGRARPLTSIVRHHQMDSFTCAGCGKDYPSSGGVELSWPAQVGFFVMTLGGVAAGRLCQSCHSGVTALGVVGALIGIVVVMALAAKWLGT